MVYHSNFESLTIKYLERKVDEINKNVQELLKRRNQIIESEEILPSEQKNKIKEIFIESVYIFRVRLSEQKIILSIPQHHDNPLLMIETNLKNKLLNVIKNKPIDCSLRFTKLLDLDSATLNQLDKINQFEISKIENKIKSMNSEEVEFYLKETNSPTRKKIIEKYFLKKN